MAFAFTAAAVKTHFLNVLMLSINLSEGLPPLDFLPSGVKTILYSVSILTFL